MLDGSSRPMRFQCESNLTSLGIDRALEIVAGALDKTFPIPQSQPDEQMDLLLHILANIDQH